MEDVKQLEIEILYFDNDGYIATFFEFTNGHDAWDYTKESVLDIWNARGGLQVTINGYRTIFSSCQFYDVLNVTSFLLMSICSIRNIDLREELVFSNFPEQGILQQSLPTAYGNSYIELDLTGSKNLLFSYRSDSTKHSTRYSRTFDGIAINKELWALEAKNALEGFFIIYKQLYDNDKGDHTMYTNYLKLWEVVRESFV